VFSYKIEFFIFFAIFKEKKIYRFNLFKLNFETCINPGSGKKSSPIRIPDPSGKKAPDPGSATLLKTRERVSYTKGLSTSLTRLSSEDPVQYSTQQPFKKEKQVLFVNPFDIIRL
jgi:hypothetical protein